MIALFLLVGTLDFRKLIRRGEEEKQQAEGAPGWPRLTRIPRLSGFGFS